MTAFAEKAYEACKQRAKALGRRLTPAEWLESVQAAYDAYPKPGRTARNETKTPPKRNELLDAIATINGGKVEEVTAVSWSGAAKALSQIKLVCPALTVDEIRRRARNYRFNFPDAILTPHALEKHWAVCGENKKYSNETGPSINRD